MKQVENIYKCIPFWSWNDELDPQGLVDQLQWMYDNGVGGVFMHARGGLKTEYLSEKWFDCIKACSEKAEELGMEAYAYDENGWPSGFVGGKLLDDIENHDRYLTYEIGEYDKNALVSYEMTGSGLKRVTSGEKCLNVYQHYAASTADILNGEVVDKFIAMTHEEYKKRDTYNLKGFFTDEPQYYRWGTAFTKAIIPYFKETYGEDILDGLGYLFVEEEGYRAFRYKYWKGMQALMLKNFAEKIYRWCDERGYKLTGHYVEETSLGMQMWCCAGVMPFYEFEHIPGIDWLSRNIGNELSPKQVSSVAAQLGKKQVITETYGCCGWDVTPDELKWIAECQYVGGVNLMCQHLLPYAEHGQRKRDYPAHFSNVNPWINKNFKEFNDYFSLLGKILAESEEQVNVAILHPIRSAYFDYKRDATHESVYELDEGLRVLMTELTTKQIPHHFVDETLLAKYGKIENKKFVMGKCAYDYLILPKMYTMDKTTETLLREFVLGGGKVLVYDGKPTYLEGERYGYDYLESNVTMEEIRAAQPFYTEQNEHVRTAIRKDAEGRTFIYAVNLGEETEMDFQLKQGKSFKAYDLFKDEYKTVSTKVKFDKKQSYLLYVSNEEPQKAKVLKPVYMGEKFTVVTPPENYLTIDYLRYSTDGKNYSESLNCMGIFAEMLERRYEGKLYLKYEFTVDELPEKCRFFAENMNTLRVEVNGEEVEKCCVSKREKNLFGYNVADKLKKGLNEVVVLINYWQSEAVYYALFGENVTESLRNCLVYDTNIEAAYLKGTFGVTGDFKAGKNEQILLGNNFRIGKAKTEITSLIEDGYPFFSGDITLKQTLVTDTADCELIVDKRYQLLEVKLNGKKVQTLMFGKRVDLSNVAKVGENELEIVLTVGNRNLLGPFHTLDQEDMSVGPYSFERMGTWKDGKSPLLLDQYAFVKGII